MGPRASRPAHGWGRATPLARLLLDRRRPRHSSTDPWCGSVRGGAPPAMTTTQIIFGLAVFLVAGTVKGLVGIGLPTITIALTSLVLPLTESIALITLPTVITNVWQAAVGGRFRY